MYEELLNSIRDHAAKRSPPFPYRVASEMEIAAEEAAQEAVATRALDMIGQALRDQGVSLDELMESGREIRGEFLSRPAKQ